MLREIDPQVASVDLSSFKLLLGLNSALNILEVGVGETTGLTGAAVHGDTNVNASADILEELVEVIVGELEGKVAHEKNGGGVVALEAEVGALDELNGQAAAHEGSVIEVLNGGGRLVEVGELDITPAV